jgi:sensor histidine kinase YesM
MTDSITALKRENEIEKRLHKEEVNRINAEKMLEKMQMSLLQSQINPHFLFNTLNTVSRMAKIEGAQKTEDLILRLSNLFRYNLQDANESVTLTKELSTISDYIFIQQKRFGDRLKFIIDCRINTDYLFVPTFTLQPIIENAIIHGIGIKEQGGTIRLRIKQKGSFAVITVTDNGVGISAEKLEILMNQTKSKGHLSSIGINNVRMRVNLLYAGSSFKIFSREKLGTVIEIKIPVQI